MGTLWGTKFFRGSGAKHVLTGGRKFGPPTLVVVSLETTMCRGWKFSAPSFAAVHYMAKQI